MSNSNSQAFWTNALTIVGGVVGLIASCLAIFTFATGVSNIPTVVSSGSNAHSNISPEDQTAIENVLDEFMTALSEEDYDQAYELFPTDFEGESSVERLTQWVEENKLFPVSWTYDEFGVDGMEAEVALNVTWEDPEEDNQLIITLDKEDDAWLIDEVVFKSP